MNTNKLESLINNLLNGNLATAKAQAKRLSGDAIRSYLAENGLSNEKSALAALYLKSPSREAFQAYCDAI